MPRRQEQPPPIVFPDLQPQQDPNLPGYIGVPETEFIRDPETGEMVEVPFQIRKDVAGRTTTSGRVGEAGMVTETDPYSYFRDPAYLEGSELQIYGMPAPALAALQRQMERAGLLEPGDYSPGAISGDTGDPTVQAFTNLLAYTNRAGFLTYEEGLRRLLNSPLPPNQQAARDREARAASRLPSVSNPDDLRRVFRAAVINELGTGWSERQIDDLVTAYQAREMQYGAYGSADPVPGVVGETNVAPPDPSTFAAETARAFDPTAAVGQDFLGTANTFFQLLSGGTPSGQLPGTQR